LKLTLAGAGEFPGFLSADRWLQAIKINGSNAAGTRRDNFMVVFFRVTGKEMLK
jgi:hypothetical protein